MSFPSTNTTEWKDFEVTFQLNMYENLDACDTCFPVFYVTNNGWPDWDQNISWSLKNVIFERLSNDINYETPITDFYNELVEIPRMDSLETVELQGWDRTDCPHEEDNLYEWHDPATWQNGIVPDTTTQNITIPIGKSVIIRSCSLEGTENDPYQRV